MKSDGWMTEPRWEWDKPGMVLVFAIDGTVDTQSPIVVKHIKQLLSEFRIPLNVLIGNLQGSNDLKLLNEMLYQSLIDKKIDYPRFEENLSGIRAKGTLPYGLVLLVDKTKYEFYKRPEQPSEAIYGVGDCNGYVILRHTHQEAVRHEFAHMLGLEHHDPPNDECIMNWKCAVPSFCEVCTQKIDEMWKDEIDTGKI